jgi:hypothetical protein
MKEGRRLRRRCRERRWRVVMLLLLNVATEAAERRD